MSRSRQATEFDLLEIYVEEMERQGVNRNLVRLDADDSMAAKLSSKTEKEVSSEQIQRLVDRCLANEWLEHAAMGVGKYGQLALTTTGFGVVRSRQRKEESLARRSFLKRASDYVEEHKGLFVALGAAIALAGLLVKLFLG